MTCPQTRRNSFKGFSECHFLNEDLSSLKKYAATGHVNTPAIYYPMGHVMIPAYLHVAGVRLIISAMLSCDPFRATLGIDQVIISQMW